jgi:hypothetical protein
MSDPKKEANMEHAKTIITNAILAAMKQITKDTGAIAVQIDAHLMYDAQMQLGAGAAGIGLVYPPEEKRAAADPQAAEKLVADLLRRLKTSRGN